VPDTFQTVGLVFGTCRLADGPDYWDDQQARYHDHRRHVRNLAIVCGFVLLAGIAVHPSLLAMLALLSPLLLLEMFMARRARTRPGSAEQVLDHAFPQLRGEPQ
jgi:hypothetical protein